MKKNDLFSSEFKLRLLIREAIKIRNKQHMSEQQELRTVIRHLIKEGEIDADAEPAPYASTPVNALADAFNEILKILKGGLRKMNQPEERLSYRAHILEKFKSIFDSFEGLDVQVSAKAIGEGDLTEQEEDTADTKLKVTLDDPDRIMPSDGAEDIRFKEKEKDPEEELETNFDAFKIAGENPTGARFAFETVNNSNIEQVLSDKRKLLFSPEYNLLEQKFQAQHKNLKWAHLKNLKCQNFLNYQKKASLNVGK